MFKKLISNLPFSPSLLEQLASYSKRMKHESSRRKIGFWLLSLGLVAQIAVTIYPSNLSPAKNPTLPLVVGFILAAIAGFLYARCRLMALELEIIRLHYINAGGM